MDRAILEEELDHRWNLEQQAILDRHRRLMRQTRAADQWRKWQDGRNALLFAAGCCLALCGAILAVWKAL
jgi:hypothetical protein